MKNQPNKILIPRFDTLGDIVLVEGLIEGLLDLYPEAEVTLFTRRQYADLSALFPERLHWLVTEVDPLVEIANPDSLHRLLSDFGRRDWDMMLATTFSRSWADDLIAAALPGSNRIGLGVWKPLVPPGLFEAVGLSAECPYDLMVPVEKSVRETEKYRALWRAISGKDVLREPGLSVSDDQAHVAGQMLQQRELKAKKFCICFPAGTQKVAIKTWPSERFVEIILWLEAHLGFRTLVAGHISEAPALQIIVDSAKDSGANPALWVGRNGEIPILAALCAEAVFYLGNDTGPMHIASAVGTPVAAIFGGGTWPRFLPLGSRSVAVAGHMPCFGCAWSCIFGDAPCMNLVMVEDVKKAISRLLDQSSPCPTIVNASTELSEDAHLLTSKAVSIHSAIEKDRGDRLLDNSRLTRLLAETEADRASRIEHIHQLGKQIEVIEADRAARLELINRLGKQVAEIEADRAARLEVIQKLVKQNEDMEAVLKKQDGLIRELTEQNHKLLEIRNHLLVRAMIKAGLVGRLKDQKRDH